MSSLQQQDLFGDEEAPPKPKRVFRVNPIHIGFKLQEFLNEFRELQSWPWSKEQVDLLGTMTFPYLYKKLENPVEAEKWRMLIDAERARLDAATTWTSNP